MLREATWTIYLIRQWLWCRSKLSSYIQNKEKTRQLDVNFWSLSGYVKNVKWETFSPIILLGKLQPLLRFKISVRQNHETNILFSKFNNTVLFNTRTSAWIYGGNDYSERRSLKELCVMYAWDVLGLIDHNYNNNACIFLKFWHGILENIYFWNLSQKPFFEIHKAYNPLK